MKRLHRQMLLMLPGPFVAWLGALMVLLLMQFLIKYLPDIVGKGLPFGIVAELVAYNLAYMVALAVPMSALIAALLTFGRLAESNAYAAMKSAGISLLQLSWPALVVGGLLTAFMIHFNNEILPEANFRARNLWQDIRRAKPGFELQPGVFYDGLNRYSILVQKVDPDTDEMHDVLIYDYTDGARRQAVVKARQGRIESAADGSTFHIVLDNGEVHRLKDGVGMSDEERYERIAFERYRLRMDLTDFGFERTEPSDNFRSDRTMRTQEMVERLDSLRVLAASTRASLREDLNRLTAGRELRPAREDEPYYAGTYSGYFEEQPAPVVQHPYAETDADTARSIAPPPPPERLSLSGVSPELAQSIINLALQDARTLRSRLENVERGVGFDERRIVRYEIEIHKKYSIAFACFIFMLLGIPLGLTLRRGGLGRMGALTIAIFVVYWASLMQGEKLADRLIISPFAGMWGVSIVLLAIGLLLFLNETRGLPLLRPNGAGRQRSQAGT
jgi:lipopolysaccharide export system permease protein